jgi:hypothetical protein
MDVLALIALTAFLTAALICQFTAITHTTIGG